MKKIDLSSRLKGIPRLSPRLTRLSLGMTEKTIILIIILSFILFLPRPSFAQQISLSLDPPVNDIFIKPGKMLTFTYKIRNYSDPIILSLNVLPFEVRDNHGNIKLKETNDDSIQFSIPNQSFFLKTNAVQDIHLKISIPPNALEKDYYYALIATTEPIPGKSSDFLLQSRLRLTSNILINVSNKNSSEINGKLTLFDIPNSYKINIFGKTFRLIDSFDKLPVSLIAENKGKNRIKPTGEITLSGNFGGKTKFTIRPDNILAYSQRLLKATNTSVKNPSKNNSSIVLSGFFLGKYQLSTNFNFGSNSSQVFSTIYFIAVPIKLIGIFLIITVPLLYLLYQRKTNKKLL